MIGFAVVSVSGAHTAVRGPQIVAGLWAVATLP